MEEPVIPGPEITPPEIETPPTDVITADPGQLEGKPKHEPPVGSPRWNEVYHKAKETERELEAERAEKATLAAKIAELEARVNTPPPAPISQPHVVPPPIPPAVRPPQDLNAVLQQMKTVRAQAYRDMDMETLAKVQDDIDTITLQMSRPDPQATVAAVRQMEIQRESMKFAHEVPWFFPTKADGSQNPSFDPIMNGAAIALQEQIGATWRGTYTELLAEVRKQVETRLAPKAPERPAIPGVGVVGGVILNNGQQGRLTAEESRVARMMFSNSPDPEKAYLEAKGVR